MSATSVRYQLTCTADDPQVPSRVLGIFAARSLLPERYLCERTGELVRIEVGVAAGDLASIDPGHLARVLQRIVAVERVELRIGGRRIDLEMEFP